MCVIMPATARVGIRELRQNLSVYVRRLRNGERFEVTDRGRVVGFLVPVPDHSSALERLVASGRAAEPEADLSDLGPPLDTSARSLSEALRATREERL
jgi:prevent-host-death family protein